MKALKPYWLLERFGHYAAALVRYYSRRSDFTTRLTTTIDTACVIPSRKQVLINPEWKRTQREVLSRVQVTGHPRLTLTLEGLAAHEAAHIRFSGDWPGGLLGQLVNALEDERIERLQEVDFPLARAFVFLGDYTLLAAEQNEAFYSAQAGILLWRFQHDFPHDVWHTGEEVWEEVRPLVEAAWVATDTDAVIALAQQIMAILGLEENAPEDAHLSALGLSGNGEAVEDAEGGDLGRGGGAGGMPRKPADDLEAFGELDERLELARPLAVQLEHILEAPRRRGRELSRSRGRLSVRRVIRREERPFERRCVQREKPLRIFLAQDVSGSMGYFVPDHPHYHALLSALALELCCSRLCIPFALISFEDETTLERPFELEAQEALLKVGLLHTRDGTTLSPALELLAGQGRPDDLVFIFCDGQLEDRDVQDSRRAAARTTATVIPILIGEGASPEQFERVFGRCYSSSSASEIPALIKRVLLAARGGR